MTSSPPPTPPPAAVDVNDYSNDPIWIERQKCLEIVQYYYYIIFKVHDLEKLQIKDTTSLAIMHACFCLIMDRLADGRHLKPNELKAVREQATATATAMVVYCGDCLHPQHAPGQCPQSVTSKLKKHSSLGVTSGRCDCTSEDSRAAAAV